jgi:hypothetical protein
VTSVSRRSLVSTSKIPPQVAEPGLQVGDGGFKHIDTFRFHGASAIQSGEL